MVLFDLWGESFIFAALYAFFVITPCVVIGVMGRNVITKLGRYPTQTPAIQMSILFPLIIVEVLTFAGLTGFYRFFSD